MIFVEVRRGWRGQTQQMQMSDLFQMAWLRLKRCATRSWMRQGFSRQDLVTYSSLCGWCVRVVVWILVCTHPLQDFCFMSRSCGSCGSCNERKTLCAFYNTLSVDICFDMFWPWSAFFQTKCRRIKKSNTFQVIRSCFWFDRFVKWNTMWKKWPAYRNRRRWWKNQCIREFLMCDWMKSIISGWRGG